MDLSFSKVTKYFPLTNTYACKEVSFSIKEGEIFGLVGENGAGKSTLMKIASGWLPPDTGSIYWENTPLVPKVQHCLAKGIFYIPQIPVYAKELTVFENLIVGNEQTSFGRSIYKTNLKDLENLNKKYNLNLPLKEKLETLTTNQLPLVGLLAALFFKARVFLFDEPTAGLSHEEIHRIFKIFRRLKKEGNTIVFISHKMDEIFEICDSLAILVKGNLEGTYKTAQISPDQLSEKLLGTDFVPKNKTIAITQEEVVYELNNITMPGQGRNHLKDVSFTLHRGEILGIAGIKESGLAILEDLVSGMKKTARGSILLKGKEVLGQEPGHLRKGGISYVPTQRIIRGASLNASVQDNLLLLKSPYFYPYGLFHFSGALQFATRLIQRFKIKGAAFDSAHGLSGGNLQKMILSRELDWQPNLLILAEPTWGLDLATRNEVYSEIQKIQQKGTAILLLTTDWEEARFLSDNLGVLADGRLSPIKKAQDWTKQELGAAMLGGQIYGT